MLLKQSSSPVGWSAEDKRSSKHKIRSIHGSKQCKKKMNSPEYYKMGYSSWLKMILDTLPAMVSHVETILLAVAAINLSEKRFNAATPLGAISIQNSGPLHKNLGRKEAMFFVAVAFHISVMSQM